jgi:hypothetical protein
MTHPSSSCLLKDITRLIATIVPVDPLTAACIPMARFSELACDVST